MHDALHRALGATRRHIAVQYLAESLMLATVGGVTGTLLGALSCAAYTGTQHWHIVVPAAAVAIGMAAALTTGTIAGLYPAFRAARLQPTQALRST